MDHTVRMESFLLFLYYYYLRMVYAFRCCHCSQLIFCTYGEFCLFYRTALTFAEFSKRVFVELTFRKRYHQYQILNCLDCGFSTVHCAGLICPNSNNIVFPKQLNSSIIKSDILLV